MDCSGTRWSWALTGSRSGCDLIDSVFILRRQFWCATSRCCSHLDTGELSVCGSLIRPVTVVRDLGVMLQSDLSMTDHMAWTVSRCFRQLHLLKGCIKSLPFKAARVAVAVTSQVDRWNSVSWIACNQSSIPLLGCCATGENTIMLHRSSVMLYTGSQFLSESSLRSVYWSTSRLMGQRLGICATTVRRRIHPLRGYNFDQRINAIFL